MMLNKEELIKQLTSTFGKTKVDKLSGLSSEQQFNLDDLIELTFHENKILGFRAAWLMDNYIRKHAEQCILSLQHLINSIHRVKNESCKRHYASILYHLTLPSSPIIIKNTLEKIDLEPVAEQLFDWIIDPKVKVAVKVFAADTLYHLSIRFPWINEELANQIQFMLKTGSAAIQERGKKLLNRLMC